MELKANKYRKKNSAKKQQKAVDAIGSGYTYDEKKSPSDIARALDAEQLAEVVKLPKL